MFLSEWREFPLAPCLAGKKKTWWQLASPCCWKRVCPWHASELVSTPVQTSPGANPASYTMGTISFPGVKPPGLGIDHPPPPSAEVKGKVEPYFYSPSGPSRPALGWNLLFTLLYSKAHDYKKERNKEFMHIQNGGYYTTYTNFYNLWLKWSAAFSS